MAPFPPSGSSTHLRATYESATGHKDFSHDLTTATALDTVSETDNPVQFSKAKTVYLSKLRSSIKQMQGDINVFLTAKMEEDKSNATTNGASSVGKGKDEVEEEHYGEEDVEDDG